MTFFYGILMQQRGKVKEEVFEQKVQQMKTEEEKQRIPVAQGLPWTTDEPEVRPFCYVMKSTVFECYMTMLWSKTQKFTIVKWHLYMFLYYYNDTRYLTLFWCYCYSVWQNLRSKKLRYLLTSSFILMCEHWTALSLMNRCLFYLHFLLLVVLFQHFGLPLCFLDLALLFAF